MVEMKVFEHPLYRKDIQYVADLNLPWELLQDSSVLLSGACGLVGSCIVDVIMYKNEAQDLNCSVYALGRNEGKAKERFAYCLESPHFCFFPHDINLPLESGSVSRADYVLHLASNTHPVAYATDPIGTVTTNIIGTYNLLDFAANSGAKRFAFASSNEIYGENRGDAEFFDEHYCGYIDSNTLRAGYPESKRCGEALCQAFRKQKDMNVVVPRLTRSYGPTMLTSDTKAISQFINKGVVGEDIVLKSAGTQYYSYTYVIDAVTGILTILLKGENGEAYNIADETGDMTLKDLASVIANFSGTKVAYEIPDEVESAGYSKATKARLDGSKLEGLGWKPKYDIQTGVERTITILRETDQGKN